jgi:hypothetical protein
MDFEEVIKQFQNGEIEKDIRQFQIDFNCLIYGSPQKKHIKKIDSS